MITTLAALLLAVQDPAALIEKLKSADADVAENARRDLLDLGERAIQPLRDAESKADQEDLKKKLGGLATRLEVRKAAQGLAAKWGEQWYSVFISGVKVGWGNLKTEEKDGSFSLNDEFFFQFDKNQTASIKTALLCAKDEYLTLKEVTLDLNTPDRSGSHAGKVKEGRLVVKSDDKTNAVKLKENTVVDTAFLRLVTLLPKTGETDLVVLQLLGQKPKFHDSAVAKCDKEESIEHGGRNVKCRRFILSDGEEDRFYFVDADNRLLKIQMRSDEKDVEIVLSDEKKAKDLDTKD